MCINEVVIYGITAKIPQTCALFSIFQLVCQIEKWLNDPKQSRTINYRRKHTTSTAERQRAKVKVRNRLLKVFPDRFVYDGPSRECMSVCHSHGFNVVLYFLFLRQCGRLCVCHVETKAFFTTSSSFTPENRMHNKNIMAIQPFNF